MEATKPDFSRLAEKWPSAYVVRDKIELFSGGMMKQNYLANLDAQGRGPVGRVRVGRKVAYTVDSVIRFLESRAQVIEGKR